MKIGPAARNSFSRMPGSWLGSQDPTGYEVGREFALSDKSEFTETNKMVDFRALIRGFRTPALCTTVERGRGRRSKASQGGNRGEVRALFRWGAPYGDLEVASRRHASPREPVIRRFVAGNDEDEPVRS